MVEPTNIENIKKILSDYAALESSIVAFALEVETARGNGKEASHYEYRRMNVEGATLVVSYEWYACGETEYADVEFPLVYLVDPLWQEVDSKAEEEKKRIRAEEWNRKQAEKKKLESEEQEKRDLANYERLKAKYG